jgi:uncharacterized repeat protein (TIGR03803 family)
MKRFGTHQIAITFLLFSLSSVAQTFTNLADFGGLNGSNPAWSLVQGADGNFYGTAQFGGGNCLSPCGGAGTVFRVSPQGKLTKLYSFCDQGACLDGYLPFGGLVLGSDGNFYGATIFGGDSNCDDGLGYGCGTVFKITPSGKLTTLYSFTGGLDGAYSFGSLAEGTDGSFYGTTQQGGAQYEGTVFKITPGGALTTLYSFCSQFDCADGLYPLAGLVLGIDGNFYGTTSIGGPEGGMGYGTIFRITPTGTLTVLHAFDEFDGNNSRSALIQASDGAFYGTTEEGGGNGGDLGTVFKITSDGTFTSLFDFGFTNGKLLDGGQPYGGVIQGTDGNFYGTNFLGGSGADCLQGYFDCGTVFSITSEGSLSTLYNFDFNYPGGSNPLAGLIQSTDGNFYGTTDYGGARVSYPSYGFGTVFRLSTGLGPFVAFVNRFGGAGKSIGILGQGFTGTTSVLLNGVPSTFTVMSDTFIKATVPGGATTGYASVTTPTGTLTSNVPFRVIP